MSRVLFEITENELETGLRGFPIGYCPTSYVDPQKGLFYADHPISECAHWEPAQVLHLLYHGKEGSAAEVADFAKELERRAPCDPSLIAYIQKLPRQGHPMKLFSAALLLAAGFEGTGDYREDCLNLIAKIPQIAAAVINHHAGWPSSNPKPHLGYMENFTHMLGVPDKSDTLADVLKLFNVLHYDHGGGNLSAFTGKAVASGLEDLYGSLAGAMCALAGPRHGRANQDCLEFVHELSEQLGNSPTEAAVEKALRDRLASRQLIFGFGHAVLRVEDARATVQYGLLERSFPDHPLSKLVLLLRKVGPKVLGENPKIADPYPNVDAVSGTLLTAAGFPYPEYFTVLFGASRCCGIAIQIVYERLEARGGKGLPIVRPKYFFRERGA
ncbi:MAG: citrate (Si)-synthase [Parachlamydiales bacterium]